MNTMCKILLACIALLLAGAPAAEAQSAAPDSVKTVLIKVRNLHCDGDMPTIKKRLINQDGIDDVAFTERDGSQATFTITYHSSATREDVIEQAIESTPGCDDKSETPYRVVKERKAKKHGS
ncbi:MAG: hypothetical protein JST06_08820 [Bacteroidetes bacterium]|nr:hypothetical protein [Bacteroidota bacterium]MBS1629929.1 hypothetical protein [Bacteroidota bacterium]